MQYRSIHLLVYLGISSLSYFVVTHLDQLQTLFPWYARLLATYGAFIENTVAVLVVAGVALLFDASSRISRFIVEDLPFSRLLRRTLSGKNFVEGDWPLVVVYGKGSPEPGKLLYLGFLTIAFRDDELCIYGDDWTPEGVHEVFFESVRSSFHADRNERRLQYFYRQGQTSQDARMRGYTEGYFFPTYEMSTLLAGEFRDAEHNDVRFYARRKKYRLWEKRVRSPEEKKAAAKEVWAEFEPRIKSMIAQPISADWR
jgi:hypothetical protein